MGENPQGTRSKRKLRETGGRDRTKPGKCPVLGRPKEGHILRRV
jgi:hypothetical protein